MKSVLPDLRERPIWEDAVGAAADSLARATKKVQPMPEYQDDPIGFAVDEMGIRRETLVWSENPGYEDHEWDGTEDPIVVLAEALAASQDVGVESGTGTGKSHALGWLSLWFQSCWRGARVFSFAAKEEQLEIYSWTEIKKLWPRFKKLFPTAELTRLRIRMDGKDEEGEEAGWGALGRSAGVGAEEEIATKAAGMHAPHMLILVEEAPGVPLPVSRAIENTCTDTHNLRLYVGNPDHQHDTLHEFCSSPGVVHVRISALDHPNIVVNEHRDPGWEDLQNDISIVPGAVSRKSVMRRRLKYGEGSRIYLTRVRGVSPSESADALIRWDWLEEAAARYSDSELREYGSPGLGVDVANSEDGDKAAIARGLGACLLEVASFRCPDSNKLGVRVGAEMTLQGVHPDHCGVDAVGVGAGTVNKLKELGKRVRGLNAGERAIPKIDRDVWVEKGKPIREEEEFYNLRSQMWWQMRMDLQHGRIALPDDRELFQDLITPEWSTRNGKIIVEPKEKIVDRLGRSPDKGDAAVMWNWVRERPKDDEPDDDLSAWDPEVLEHESKEKRKVRDKPPIRKDDLPPHLIERL